MAPRLGPRTNYTFYRGQALGSRGIIGNTLARRAANQQTKQLISPESQQI